MSKHDFAIEEFEERRRRVRAAMCAQEIEVLIVVHPVCLHWLTGTDTKSYQSFQSLFIAVDPNSPLVMITRESERAEYLDDALVDELRTFAGPEPSDPMELFANTVSEFGFAQRRVGLEVPAFYLHPHHYQKIRECLGNSLVAEPSNLVHSLKYKKSIREIEYIREASRIVDLAMHSAIAATRPGITELDLAAEVYHTMLSNGSGIPASPINLVSGERLCFSHGMPTHRRLQAEDGINIEFGAAYRRYTATLGRHINIGKPSPRMREIYDICRTACDACIATIKDGVPAIEPHLAAKKVIADAGLDQYRVHTTGYGIAPGSPPSWGEPLNMYGGTTDVLKAGMVVSVEPPIYIHEERLGARIIDNVLVTNDGCEVLSNVTRDLIVV